MSVGRAAGRRGTGGPPSCMCWWRSSSEPLVGRPGPPETLQLQGRKDELIRSVGFERLSRGLVSQAGLGVEGFEQVLHGTIREW